MDQPGMIGVADKLRIRLDGGLIPAVPLPFDGDGRLHRSAHESYLRYMTEQPVAGVAVWAHTGRGLMLDKETACAALRDFRSALRDRIVIAGVGSRQTDTPERATEVSLEMAERAARGGADALLIYAPSWLRGHKRAEAMIVDHHQRLATLGLPMVLFYLYEAAGGISYSPAVLDELLAMPNVLGIKMATLDSVMTYQDVARLISTRYPQKLLITGEDRFLGYSLRRGARAALIGMGAVCSGMQAALVSSHLKGEAELFLALSDKADLLAESIFIAPMEGYITRLLWALVHLGIIPREAANDPWGPKLPASEFEEIGRTLASLNYSG